MNTAARIALYGASFLIGFLVGYFILGPLIISLVGS